MRLPRFTFVLLLFAASLGAVAAAADKQAQVQAAYDHQCKTVVAKDIRGFESTLSPSFVAIDLDNNSLTVDQVADAVESPPLGMLFDQCAVLIRGFSIDGNLATVAETQTSAGTLYDQGTSKPFVHVEDSIDTWNVSGTPRELTSKGTGERLTVDGVAMLDRGILASPQP
jgi:hypothetical protein